MNHSGEGVVIEISDDSNDGVVLESQRKRSRVSISDTDSSTSESSSDDDDVAIVVGESSDEEDDPNDETWDEDCVVSKLRPSRQTISGVHLMPTCEPDPGLKIKKPRISVELNSTYTKDEHFATLRDHFANDNAYEDKSCEIVCDPWKVLVLDDLVAETDTLESARLEFYETSFNTRTMDLYEFFQSDDLKDVADGPLRTVYEFIKGDLRTWTEKFTGLELVETSATCSFYGDTDFLLVHDDQRGNRAVAFVLYLTGTEGWREDWGGALQLFDCDSSVEPRKSARSIYPKNNRLVLFPVSERSYHQVDEVSCMNYCRLSINGWFHTKEPLKFDTPTYEPPSTGIHSESFERPLADADLKLRSWIDWSYFQTDTVGMIKSYIEDDSEMSLEKFFRPEKLDDVLTSLRNEDIEWTRMGPPNRRNYEYLNTSHIPETLKTFLALFRSQKFVDVLKSFTDLNLTKLKWELQRWSSGSYSLLDEKSGNRLDVIMYLCDCDFVGGKSHYVDLKEEGAQEALLTIQPERNTVNLVYGDAALYTAYMSRRSRAEKFYLLTASYYEDEDAS